MDQDKQAESDQPLELKDFYFEGPNLVFTAAYLLKRGTCCGSGCRHCPFGNSAADQESLAGPSF